MPGFKSPFLLLSPQALFVLVFVFFYNIPLLYSQSRLSLSHPSLFFDAFSFF